jgi:hypothetical protein
MSHASFPFPHSKLDVFHVALQLAAQARRISVRVPRGYRSFADQLKRAAESTVLLIGKGRQRAQAAARQGRNVSATSEAAFGHYLRRYGVPFGTVGALLGHYPGRKCVAIASSAQH